MANSPWAGQGTSFPRSVIVQLVAAGNTGTTDAFACQNYTWIDWYVSISAGSAGITTISFVPFALASNFGPTRLPYEPAVAGTGTTVVYPYTFTFTVAPATAYSQAFRTPSMGTSMYLTWTANGAETATVEIYAMPRI